MTCDDAFRPKGGAPPPGPDLTACPSDLDLASFVDGQLDEGRHAAFVRHLDGCADCRDVVRTVCEALEADEAADASATRRRSRGPSE